MRWLQYLKKNIANSLKNIFFGNVIVSCQDVFLSGFNFDGRIVARLTNPTANEILNVH